MLHTLYTVARVTHTELDATSETLPTMYPTWELAHTAAKTLWAYAIAQRTTGLTYHVCTYRAAGVSGHEN